MILETKITADMAAQTLCALHGHYIWCLKAEIDSVLRFEVGKPSLLVRNDLSKVTGSADPAAMRRIVRPIGQWSVFVGTGIWQIDHQGGQITRANNPNLETSSDVQRGFSNLNGQKLLDIRWKAEAKEWRFFFDLGGEISIRADPNEQDGPLNTQWTISSRKGGRISCKEDDFLVIYGDI